MTMDPTTPDPNPKSSSETPQITQTPPPADADAPPPPPLARAGMTLPRGEPLPPPKEKNEDPGKAEADESVAENAPPEIDEQEDEQELDAMFRAAVDGIEEGPGITPGEIREVQVVAISGETVFVDVGDKAEGVIPLGDFLDPDGVPQIAVGQTIPVEIRGHDSETGQVRVSYKSAIARLSVARIEEAFEKKEALVGRVVAVVKGGLVVDVGLQAFMPASQTDLYRVEDLSQFVGQKVEVLVIEFNRQRKRAVVSRRQRLQEEQKESKHRLLEGLKPGETMDGTVKNIRDFGVFVDLGGIDGFIPREEISYDRGASTDQFFKVGDVVQVKVLKVDPNNERITLSRKQTGTDPWENAEMRFPLGSRVRGKVVSLTHYGAFVQLTEGITGMIHASDMSWSTKSNIKPSEFVNEGDLVEAQVLEISEEKRRLSLGLKHITMDPWIEVEAKYPVGTKVKGTVSSLTAYGAFIRLDEHIEGMIHVSDLSWEKRISHPNKVLKMGEEIECLVLKADPLQRRLSLGVKQLEDSPFETFERGCPVGSVVTGEVTRIMPFGAFVKLPGDLEGLLHVSQIDEQRIEDPGQVLKVGEKVTCKVTKVDSRSQKISLSRKEALKQMDRDFMKQYQNREASGGMNFGEALRLAAVGQTTPAPEFAAPEPVAAEPVAPEPAAPEPAAPEPAAEPPPHKPTDPDTQPPQPPEPPKPEVHEAETISDIGPDAAPTPDEPEAVPPPEKADEPTAKVELPPLPSSLLSTKPEEKKAEE